MPLTDERRGLIGEVLGPYRLTALLGAGGMGAVYEAEDGRTAERVAIKILHRAMAAEAGQRDRFLREAQAIQRVRHAGVVEIYAAGESEGGLLYIVMERLLGESLAQRLRGQAGGLGRLGLPVLQQIAAALVAAHERGVIHRDLKPANVMLLAGPVERVKLLDFGIAKIVDRDVGPALTASHAVLGTPMYMSPEQCRGSRDVDGRSDVYALGVLSYEVLSGRLPFQGERSEELMRRHLHDSAPRLSQEARGLPVGVSDLVGRMMAKEARERPDMAEVRARLSELCAAEGAGPRPGRGRRWVMAGMVAGLCGLSGLVAAPRVLRVMPRVRAAVAGVTAPAASETWVYSLHDKHSGARVYGVFVLGGVASAPVVTQGRVWYAGDRPEAHLQRGAWRSKAAAVAGDSLYVIFEMESTTERAEASEARYYPGLLELTRAGAGQMVGTYHDLGPRHAHWGTVQAERVGVVDLAGAIDREAYSAAVLDQAYRRFGGGE